MTNLNDQKIYLNYESIYASIPEFLRLSFKKKIMYIKKDLVKKWFLANPEVIICAKDINKLLLIKKEPTSIYFRKIVLDLIEEGMPIVTSKEGYIFTKDIRKIQNNLETNIKRISGILRRNNALKNIIMTIENGIK
jgi:hypothetical protein